MIRNGRNHWRQIVKLAVAGTGPSGASANVAVRHFASEANGASKGGKGFVSVPTLASYLACISARCKVNDNANRVSDLCCRERSWLLEEA